MGVVRLFSEFYKEYSKCIYKLFKKNGKYIDTFRDLSLQIDNLYIDLNAIIHPICGELYGYNKKKVNVPLRSKKQHEQPENIADVDINIVYNEICKEINKLRVIVKPTKKIYIAIDGVAGMSKSNQQRQRRFNSTKGKKDDMNMSKFDPTCISTGTEFMRNFSKYLNVYIQNQMKTNKDWMHLEVIFSNDLVPSEGEQKLIKHIYTNSSNTNSVIVSPDADLLILSLPLNNVYVLRPNTYDYVKCEYFVVDIDKLRTDITHKLQWLSLDRDFSVLNAMHDLIYTFSMIGNDFLPHVPGLEICNNAIEFILTNQSNTSMTHGFITTIKKDEMSGKDDVYINKESLKQFLYYMANNEYYMLTHRLNIKNPDPMIVRHMKNHILDIDAYKEEYYKIKMNNVDVELICHEYIRGLLFVVKYYLINMPDWEYCYPFYYAPFFSDLHKYVDTFDFDMKFIEHEPLSVYEQLLSIMPAKRSNLLPEPLRFLMESSDSSILDFYPVYLKIDLDGKINEYEGIVILPFVDVNKLKVSFNSVEPELTDDERKNNRKGRAMRYKNINGTCVREYI